MTTGVQGQRCELARSDGITDSQANYLARLDKFARSFAKRHKMDDTLRLIERGDDAYSAVNSMVYLLDRSGFPRLLRLWNAGTSKIN